MTEAEAAIRDLDSALAEAGENIRLQRLTLGPNGAQIPFEVTCRASVRQYQPSELAGGIIQGDSLVILSPTEIIKAQWPGGTPQSSDADKRVPRGGAGQGDKVIIQGRARNIEAAAPYYLAGELVRIELQCRG